MLSRSGVYKITCVPTGKIYIGSAACFRNRWKKHRNDAIRGEHHNRHFQRAWNKYGADAFEFAIVLVCSREQSVFYEQRAIDAIRPNFNVSPTAGSCLGVKHSKATCEKKSGIGNPFYGKSHSQETIEQLSGENNRMFGKHIPRETRDKISAALKGCTRSEETKARMSASRKRLGQRPSAEAIEKAAQVCRGRTLSADTRQKMSAAMKGRVHSKEAIKKLSDTRKRLGLKPSLEAIQRSVEKSSVKIVVGDQVYRSISDAARALGVGCTTISRWVKSGVSTSRQPSLRNLQVRVVE